MKKLLTVALVLLLVVGCVLGLTACDQTIDYAKYPQKTSYKVGVCQLVQHTSLDQATQGFVDALKAEVESAGKTIEIKIDNAGGDAANCTTIINTYVNGGYDLIMANATPALQTAASATRAIPILGTSITSYEVALGTIPDYVRGASDLVPADRQVAMIKELFPNAQKVGILYCSAEPNSVYQVEKMQEELTKLNITSEKFSFADSNDLPTTLQSACSASKDCDLIYVPTDNTAASNAKLIDSICSQANMPVVTAEENTCRDCGVATLSISYYELGQVAGKMAAKVLLEGKSLADMEIGYCQNVVYKYNEKYATKYGVAIDTDKYQKIEVEE